MVAGLGATHETAAALNPGNLCAAARAMTRIRRAGLALAAVLRGHLRGGGRSAHAELLSSDPPPGAVLDVAPNHVALTFSEPVEISLGAIRLFDGTGTSIDIGAARHPEGRGEQVDIDLPDLANGSYVVDWRVVSSDCTRACCLQFRSAQPNLSSGLLEQIISSNHTGGTRHRTRCQSLAVDRSDRSRVRGCSPADWGCPFGSRSARS